MASRLASLSKNQKWAIGGGIAILLVIGGIQNATKKNPTDVAASRTSTPTSTHALVSSSGSSAAATHASPPSPTAQRESSEHRYVVGIAAVAARVQATVQVVQLVVQEASTGAGDVNGIALQAQQAHDNLTNLKSDFVSHNWPGRFDTDSANAYDAINGLKNSMGALVAYAGDPNPATLAHFNSQYQPALAEWDQAITDMWSVAGVKAPPTI